MKRNEITLPMNVDTENGTILIGTLKDFQKIIIVNKPNFMVIKVGDYYYLTPRLKGYLKVALPIDFQQYSQAYIKLNDLIFSTLKKQSLKEIVPAPFSIAELSLGISMSKVPELLRFDLLRCVTVESNNLPTFSKKVREILKDTETPISTITQKATYVQILLNSSDMIRKATNEASLKKLIASSLNN